MGRVRRRPWVVCREQVRMQSVSSTGTLHVADPSHGIPWVLILDTK